MNTIACRSGMGTMVCIVLISSFLFTCTIVWKGVMYFTDFSNQRYVYMQNKYIVEGLMRWTARWIFANWSLTISGLAVGKKSVYRVPRITTDIERFASTWAEITITRDTLESFLIKVDFLQEKNSIITGTYRIVREKKQHNKTDIQFHVVDWCIGM